MNGTGGDGPTPTSNGERAYARPTDRYADFHGSLDCLLADANFSVPPKAQRDLFDQVGGGLR